MLRNYLAAALRNLVNNWLYVAINVAGLAVGFAAAIFALLFVRNELTYDQWIPGHERVYVVATAYAFTAGGLPEEHFRAHRDAAAWLTQDYPQVEAAARLGREPELTFRHGDVRAAESPVAWADAGLFTVLPFSAIAGNLATALDQPDDIVLTQALARKYFGRDRPIGETIDVNGRPMRITAVIQDWPSNTTFDAQAFISSQSALSIARQMDPGRASESDPNSVIRSDVFVKLKPGASVDSLARDMPAFVTRHMPAAFGPVTMRLLPLTARHLDPTINPYSPPARATQLAAIYGAAGIGILIVLAAAVNFVNGATARATRRAIEIGVRKVTGAARRQLIVQFTAETTMHVALGMAAAVVLVSVLLPGFQALVGRAVPFAPWHDKDLALGIVGGSLLTGVLAGLYPSFVLAWLPPAVVLKSGRIDASGSGGLRRGLVVLQFAVLIGVAVMTIVAYRQTQFAMNEGLRFDKDQVLQVRNGCTEAMKREVAALPGVHAVACGAGVGDGGYYAAATGPNGASLHDHQDPVFAAVDFGLFELIGLKPLAGRFFDPRYGEDTPAQDGSSNPSVVINESAVRALGYRTPAEAVGQIITWRRRLSAATVGGIAAAPASGPMLPSRIVGVVPDYSTMSKTPIYTRIYYVDPKLGRTLNVKLTGRDIPETLTAIERLWTRLIDPARPARVEFIEQRLEFLYRDMRRETMTVAGFATVALFIAGLGLFGLSAFMAERRTKEIGIRKAMGASRGDILRLLLWEFTKPVLCANLFAWPVAYFFARHWLNGYANRITLDPWTFLASSAAALAIAALTVIGHAMLIARVQPNAALRYE